MLHSERASTQSPGKNSEGLQCGHMWVSPVWGEQMCLEMVEEGAGTKVEVTRHNHC